MKKINISILFIILSINAFSQTVYYDDATKLYGIIDKLGKIILKPTYKWMSRIEHGTCIFKLNNKFGLLNEKGIVVLKPIFNDKYNLSIAKINEINEGVFRVLERKYLDKDSLSWSERIGYCNTNGVFKIPYSFDWASEFSNGIASVSLGFEKDNFINANGEYLSDKWFTYTIKLNGIYYGIEESENGNRIFYKININKKIELAQNQTSLNKFFEEGEFENNTLHPYKDIQIGEEKRIVTNLYGYKNEINEVKIPPKYHLGLDFNNNRALVLMDEMIFIINEKGEIICNLSEKIPKIKIWYGGGNINRFENGIIELYTYESTWVGEEQTHVFKYYLIDVNGNIVKELSKSSDIKYNRN